MSRASITPVALFGGYLIGSVLISVVMIAASSVGLAPRETLEDLMRMGCRTTSARD